MFSWFRKRRQEKEDIATDAAILIQSYGRAAWEQTFSRMRNQSLPEDERTRASRVLRVIEKHFGIERQSDTATRYLDN
jgi:hypothetical protein